MALNQPRQFRYRPPERRRRQLEGNGTEEVRSRIDLPKADDGRTSTTGQGGILAGPVKLLIMLGAVIALAAALAAFG